MFDILNVFFGRVPIAGEIYEFSKNDKSPFDNNRPHKVEVIAVKKGWVNYRWLDSVMWQDESMEIGSFRFCYRLVNTACSGRLEGSAKSELFVTDDVLPEKTITGWIAKSAKLSGVFWWDYAELQCIVYKNKGTQDDWQPEDWPPVKVVITVKKELLKSGGSR
jgi:hypothetical protein